MRRLWELYSDSVLPAEESSFFEHFKLRPTTREEFEASPQVLLLGQYSTGKTSMVKWLTGSNSAHFDVRPQPSTDKFMAIVHGGQERLINGNAAASLQQLPYQGLSMFGGSFLGSFQALVLPSDILKEITLIDTPGVLAGSKQRIGRDYDFAAVCAWLAERVDLVLLTFDAHKLDVSDELADVIEVLRPHASKVRLVLNKADQVDAANLVGVYGALLWNVAKILRTPEVARVFVSSFWDQEYIHEDHRQLFDEDKRTILKELRGLPRATVLRKANELLGRMRLVKAHYCVMTYMRSQVPWFLMTCGTEGRIRAWLLGNLPRLFAEAQQLRNVSPGDMPGMAGFAERLRSLEYPSRLPTWDPEVVAQLDRAINEDVPEVIDRVGGVSAPQMSLSTPEAIVGKQRFSLLGRLGFGGSSGSDGASRKRRRSDA